MRIATATWLVATTLKAEACMPGALDIAAAQAGIAETRATAARGRVRQSGMVTIRIVRIEAPER